MIKTAQKLAVVTLLASLSMVVSACLKKPLVNTNTNQPANTNQNENVNQNANQPVSQNINQNVNQNISINPTTTTEEIDTSDWKTYRNEEYGFEFRYPRDWYLDHCNRDEGFNEVLDILSDIEVACNVNMLESKISIGKVNNYYDWKTRLMNYLEEIVVVGNNQATKISGDLPYKDADGNVIPNTWVRIVDIYIQIPVEDIYIVLRFHSGYGKIGLPQLVNDIKIYNDLVESFSFIK